ncbi:MAG: hypothetical protein HRT68_05215 [Flavobacteriaceae bacterium]|nr:hypothetical protein [Flavobacteriaceae bacterium]
MKAFYILILAIILSFSISSCATRTRVVTKPAPSVTVVKVAPKKHRIVTVRGKRYYYWNGRHYRKTRRGYVYVRI